ncbi:MAG: hypothetical protein KGD68_01875 [Candidatus Lokiarchaeota archaeon]|nr:hypothetical protein [Candidatus Lokiarchaeota archaeon]
MLFKKKKEEMFIIGMFSLLIAILLGRFGGQYVLTDFLEGLLTGISLVMNLCFLVRYGKERRMNDKISQN